MAEQLDPEEWAEIMNEAFGLLTVPVARYQGKVARLMGDAILAFFGAPIAHEDDPQRAVLAALDILEGIRPFRYQIEREYGLDFNVRVGINTGPVVVGDVGSELAGEYTAMGDAVNIAARMEQTAQPGTVQVAGNTYRLVEPLFDFEPLGGIAVKSKGEPVPAYRVLGRKAEPGRLRGIEGLSAPLIGRAEEFGRLQQVITEVRQGRGQIVCMIGEAGLGKSRLFEELRAQWLKEANGDWSWIETHGISYDTTRPYGQFQQHMRRLYGVDENEPLEIVDAWLAQNPERFPPELDARLSPLIDRAVELLLAVRSEPDGPQLEGEALKRETFETMLKVWHEVASHAPTVMAFDDLQWADPASVELLMHLFQLTEEVPVLFLCATRPERRSPAWQVKQRAETDYPHLYTEIAVTPLSSEDSDTLVGSLLSVADLPIQLRQVILEKTEGNPFFLEEVVRSLIDSGAVVPDENGTRWRAVGTVESIAIPDSLQALLVSRFDRLEEDARRTLQLASVIGRSFYYRVLERVSDSDIALDKQLSTLQRVGLIRETARLPDLEYAFRHELTREAAYNSILRRRRREFHKNVGEAIESLFPDRLEEQANRLAYHFYEGRDNQRSLKYYTMAGDSAARLYANTEAASHYTRAVELARGDAAPNEQLIYLYKTLGRTLELCGRYDEALATYHELESIAQERGDVSLELAALLPSATVHSTFTASFDPEQGRALSNRTLALAQGLKDHSAEAKALWNLMLLEMYGGRDPEQAVPYGERSLAIAREHDLHEEQAYALNDLGKAYYMTGRAQQALEAQDEAAGLWRELGNMPMLADNLVSSAYGFLLSAEYDKAMMSVEEGLGVSKSSANTWGEAVSLFVMGLIHLERGEIGKGVEALQEAAVLTEQANMAIQMGGPIVLAYVYAVLGEVDRGFELAREELSKAGEQVEARQNALVVLARLHLSAADPAEADAAINEAKGLSEKGEIDPMSDLGLFQLIEGEVALANNEYDRVLALADRTADSMRKIGMRLFLPDVLRLKGQALLGLSRTTEARELLQEARAEAEDQGSRRALWQALHALWQLEAQHGVPAESEALRRQARAAIEYISDRAGTPELRASFLGLPSVRAILDG